MLRHQQTNGHMYTHARHMHAQTYTHTDTSSTVLLALQTQTPTTVHTCVYNQSPVLIPNIQRSPWPEVEPDISSLHHPATVLSSYHLLCTTDFTIQ